MKNILIIYFISLYLQTISADRTKNCKSSVDCAMNYNGAKTNCGLKTHLYIGQGLPEM